MCEKCENPKLAHHEDATVKPLQKKLNSNALKGKVKAKKTSPKV